MIIKTNYQNIEMKNKIIIISSPSGAGKTTICNNLIKKMKNIQISISYTTRPIRKNEKNGHDYYFVTKKEFDNLKNKNFFIETAKVFGYFYGSPKTNILNGIKNKKNILFDIDWQGAKKIRKIYKSNDIIDFFILPPNEKELKKRLEKRGRENKKEIEKRLSLALSETSHYIEYKHVIVNKTIQKTVEKVIKIINQNNKN